MNQRAMVKQRWPFLDHWAVWLLLLASLIGGMPAAGWGAACGADAQRHYERGTQIGQGYCDEPCLHEKLRAYQQAIALCPDYAEAHNNLGDVYEKLSRFPEALRHYQRSTELDPHLAVAYLGLGDVYLRTGEYAQAVAAYDQGLRLNPEQPLLVEELRSQRANAELLQQKQKDGNPLDATTIAMILGKPTTMGPAGVRADRRVALRIPFASASDRLLPEAQPPLRELGKALGDILAAESDKVEFVIEGHTDLRGSEEYNMDLSLRRARQVKEALVREFRIPARRLTVIGRGKTVPLTTGTSDADDARNRRVEIVRQNIPPPPPPPPSVEAAIFYEDLEGRPRPLEAGAILRSGDGYRISLKPRQSCYVYLLQRDGAGKVARLKFDGASDAADDYLQANTEYWMPSPNHWLELDRSRGKETLYFIASREPMMQSDLDDLLRTALAARQPPDPKLDEATKNMGIGGTRPGRTEATTAAPPPQDRGVTVTTFTFQHQ